MNLKGVDGLSRKEGELAAKAEISLILDDYEDIFSDFDPRPHSQRALSVDFLEEAKRATREQRDGGFELGILVPAVRRRLEKESIIKGRLKEHFKKHANILDKEKRGVLKQGITFFVFGILFMFFAAYILVYYRTNLGLIKEFLVVLLEPGGWFLFWEGLDLMIFETKRIRPDLDFYKKMTKAEINFNHY